MTVKLRERVRAGAVAGWTADIRVRLPSGEKYRERVRAPVSSKSAAMRWALDREMYLIRNGPNAKEEEKAVPTLDGFADRFIENADVNNKPSTAYGKREILKKHLRPAFGAKRLDKITTADVESYKAQKLRVGLSKKSINNHLIVLRRVLTLAHEWSELPAVPKVKEFRLEDAPFQFLDFEETERMLKTCSSEWSAMVTVAVKTGLRQGELRALHWEDVDLVAGRLVVRRSLWRGREDSPKGGRSREVALCETALNALKAHRLRTRMKSRYVFCTDEGKPFPEADVLHVVADACNRAGLSKRLTWHELRHTFASHLVMRGVPLKAVQELLGHASIEMTMRYAHLSPDARREAVKVLDAPAPVASVVARQEAE